MPTYVAYRRGVSPPLAGNRRRRFTTVGPRGLMREPCRRTRRIARSGSSTCLLPDSGMVARHRVPRAARAPAHPRTRANLVEARASSMKVGPLGSRSDWPSNLRHRAARASGRRRSAACPVFLSPDSALAEIYRHQRRTDVAVAGQERDDLVEGDVPARGQQTQDEVFVGIQFRVDLRALRLGSNRSGRSVQAALNANRRLAEERAGFRYLDPGPVALRSHDWHSGLEFQRRPIPS